MQLNELRMWQKTEINLVRRVNDFILYCLTNGFAPETITVSNNIFQSLLLAALQSKTQIDTSIKKVQVNILGHVCAVNLDETLPDGSICAHRED